MSGVPLERVVDGLRRENLLSEAAAESAVQLLARMSAVQPWYVRAMVGFGAWLASLLLIGFVAGFSLALGDVSLVGLALVAGAVLARRQHDNDFVVQSALATSLAGQGLFAYGVAELLPGNEAETFCVVVLAVSGVLFVVFPDRIHRVLSVLFAASALVTLLYLWELNALVPVLGPALAAALVLLHERRAGSTAGGRGHLVRPLQSGLMLSAFGSLLLSTVYLLPELQVDFTFYPRPWLSTLLLGTLLLYVVSRVSPVLLAGAGRPAALLLQGLVVLTIVAAWAAPGLLLALIVALLGAAAGNRVFLGAGIMFLALFVGVYFYGIEVTMLTKSITLAATGVSLLLVRRVLLAVLAAPAEAPSHG